MAEGKLTTDDIHLHAAALHLCLLGVAGVTDGDPVPSGSKSIALFGPLEPSFWDYFTNSPEYLDGTTDPLDRWSTRTVGSLAKTLEGTALFPFGEPVQPFIGWALRTGRAWSSPVAMLVHDQAGLFLSIRGAVVLDHLPDLTAHSVNPCNRCDAPCETACPVGALGHQTYDVASCHAFLNTPDGKDCMDNGCAARRACPVSKTSGREFAQSAFHMRSFHP